MTKIEQYDPLNAIFKILAAENGKCKKLNFQKPRFNLL